MIQEEKELLLKDLCARLPYGVICHINGDDTNTPKKLIRIEVDELDGILLDFWAKREDYLSIQVYLSEVKPYLRPMSSMTEEEKEELSHLLPKYWSLEIDKLGDLYFDICDASYPDIELLTDIIDWLNAHHFDYRGLIEKGLAIAVTEDNNPYKE